MRILSIDILKIVLSLMVVGIHINFLHDTSTYVEYLTSSGIFRIAVPIFFIINGYYFHKLDENKINKWILNICVMYAFWGMVYSPFWFSGISISTFKNILIGYSHLWYLPALIFSALSVKLMVNFNVNMLIVSLISIAAGLVLQYSAVYPIVGYDISLFLYKYNFLYRNFILFGLPFFIIGWYISKSKFNFKFIFIYLCFSFLIVLIESDFNYHHAPGRKYFDILASLYLLCPVVFLYFKRFEITHNSKKIIQLSSIIYFTHPLVIFATFKFNLIENTGVNISIFVLILSIFLFYMTIIINKIIHEKVGFRII